MVEEVVERLEFERADELVNAAEKIIIITHARPDGDAIGSLVGMGLALQAQGKQVIMGVDDGVGADFHFIKGTQDVLPEPDGQTADLIISVDASSADRTGVWGQYALNLGKPIVVLDHHPTNTFFGDAHIVKSHYVSATEAVLAWLDHLGWQLNAEVAHALLLGLVTDTMCFRVGYVSQQTFKVAQRLMAFNLDLREIVERTLVQVPSSHLRALGRGLENAKLEDHVIWTSLTYQEQEELGLLEDRKPELSNELLRDKNAYIAVFFTETEEGDIRLSLRSIPGFDVASVALSFGGGGHTQAAGCTIEGATLQEAMDRAIPLLKAEAQRGMPNYS